MRGGRGGDVASKLTGSAIKVCETGFEGGGGAANERVFSQGYM